LTPSSFNFHFDPEKDGEDQYDLRMGESKMNTSQDGNGYQDRLNKTHALRAEIEDYRQKLIQADQVNDFYKKVLDEEVVKKNDLKKQLAHLKLVQEYGYDDDDNDMAQLKMRVEDMQMLLEEKNIALDAQKQINLQLTLQNQHMPKK